MNPSYKLVIDLTLVKQVEGHDILLRHIRYVPFVPRSGDTIRLTSEDEENTIDLPLESVVYDAADGHFVAEIEDSSLLEEIRAQGSCDEKGQIAVYKTLGFERLSFPTAQAIRSIGT